MLDVIISGGRVYDGNGTPPVTADVGMVGDTIHAIGDLGRVEAHQRIAAAGQVVCPGFIDVHSHSDAYLLVEPSAPSKLFQGVTTEVVGNCGASAAPLDGAYQLPSDWREKHYPGTWKTVAGYRTLLESVRPAPNVVLLIGHNTLRAGTAGYENRALTPEEAAQMGRRLEQALDEGGRGLSTGLIYSPGLFAPIAEIVELARIVARYDGIYTSHMRNEGARLPEAIDETLMIGQASGARVQISHLKTSGRANWHRVDAALERIQSGMNAGIRVKADRYPYTASSTDLDVVLPGWAAEGGRDVILARLAEPGLRARIRQEMLEGRPQDAWGNITIASTAHPDNLRFQGTRLPQVAEALGMDAVDATLHLITTDRLMTSAFFFGMCEQNMRRILAEPFVMIGSDASLRNITGPLSTDFPHPRAYGTFPRFIRMALDTGLLPLSEAIRKMTSLPAEHFNLKDRGLIAKGMKADLIVFDPARFRDTADYARPHQFATGIQSVLVNGTLTLNDGRMTGARAGRML
jgi:N-acyl-D-amino-acid deacylase